MMHKMDAIVSMKSTPEKIYLFAIAYHQQKLLSNLQSKRFKELLFRQYKKFSLTFRLLVRNTNFNRRYGNPKLTIKNISVITFTVPKL